MLGYFKFLLFGVYFGVVLTKSEVVSWFRIRDMFYFREPDLYLIIGSAVVTGMLSIWLLKKFHLRSVTGEEIIIPKKPLNKGTFLGGFLFGLGWFITGACPGPIYAQIGAGESAAFITLGGALLGAYLYAVLSPRLPN